MRLEIDGITKRFGGLAAVDDVSLDFPGGAVTALIGPNGAGKTTLFNIVSGFLRPDSGSVMLLDGDTSVPQRSNLVGHAPYEVARAGVGVLFQDIRIFKGLSALENVEVAFGAQAGESPLTCLLRPARSRSEAREVTSRALLLLDDVGLSAKRQLLAAELSYGEQKLVAIARLLAANARILLLDEPTSGVAPEMIASLLRLVQRLAEEQGCAVAMIEHNLNVVKDVGDWVYLMAQGRVEVFGDPKEVLRDRSLFEMFPTL